MSIEHPTCVFHWMTRFQCSCITCCFDWPIVIKIYYWVVFSWVFVWIDDLELLSRVESRRSLRVKADDPQKDQSRRSRSKADDPWVKADDPSKSRRSFVKADDLLGSKQTILRSKQTIFESKQTIRGESRRSQGWKRTILSEFFKAWKRTILRDESRRSTFIY